MTLARYAKRRDANEGAIRTLMHKLGWQTWKLDTPCDLLVLAWGRWYACEVKTKGSRLTPDQDVFVRQATLGQGRVFILKSDDCVMRMREELMREVERAV